jgi:hypothetical protein
MPLLRGSFIGYDTGRMTFDFRMLTSDARTVHCGISSSAMDILNGTKGTLPQEREAQFAKLRDKIEQVASDLFDQDATYHIRIFFKHVGVPRNRVPRDKL